VNNLKLNDRLLLKRLNLIVNIHSESAKVR